MSASTSYPLTIPVPIAQGGTNATTASAARSSLSAAQSGANTDITSMNAVATIQMGGTTSAFPMIQRSTTQVRFRLADNSDWADIVANIGNHASSVNAQAASGLNYFMGPVSQVGFKFSGTTIIQARLGDDSNFCDMQGNLRCSANAVTGLAAGVLAALTNATIVVKDASGQAYRIPCII